MSDAPAESIMLDRREFKPPFWLAATLNAVALWLPFSWIFLMDYPWNGYRLTWLKFWPTMPGFAPGLCVSWLLGLDTVRLPIPMGIFTLIFLSILVWWGMRGSISLTFSVLASLLISVPTAIFSYVLFRA